VTDAVAVTADWDDSKMTESTEFESTGEELPFPNRVTRVNPSSNFLVRADLVALRVDIVAAGAVVVVVPSDYSSSSRLVCALKSWMKIPRC
jgi:hypothetical protein